MIFNVNMPQKDKIISMDKEIKTYELMQIFVKTSMKTLYDYKGKKKIHTIFK